MPVAGLRLLEPGAQRFRPIPRRALYVLRHLHLVPKIVVDDPFAPGKLHPIDIFGRAEKKAGPFGARGGRGSDCPPPVAGKIRSPPRVSTPAAHEVSAGRVVLLPGKKAVAPPRGKLFSGAGAG